MRQGFRALKDTSGEMLVFNTVVISQVARKTKGAAHNGAQVHLRYSTEGHPSFIQLSNEDPA